MVVLQKPVVVYSDRVTIRWDMELERPALFEKTILKRGGAVILETTDINVTEYRDETITEGDVTYTVEVHLSTVGDDGDKINFTDSSEYIYDDSLVVIADGSARFTGHAGVTVTTEAVDLLSDSGTEVVDGKLQLKEVM